jgi:hypothetical protein
VRIISLIIEKIKKVTIPLPKKMRGVLYWTAAALQPNK